jgi:hypothetical protein
MLITPWALTTFGAATAEAVAVAAAALRKLRRVARADFASFDMDFLPDSGALQAAPLLRQDDIPDLTRHRQLQRCLAAAAVEAEAFARRRSTWGRLPTAEIEEPGRRVTPR